jgi:hypothetical protein
MFRLVAAGVVATLAFVCEPRAQSVYEIADQLDILPTPRQIELSGDAVPLQGWQIHVPTGAAEWTAVATNELNSRIVELGGTPLPVVTAGDDGRPTIYIGRWLDPRIRDISSSLGARLTPADPGEQGYVIAFGTDDGIPAILLGGSDRQGTLYATVTFRRLIQRRGGDIVALGATVRDWPDFKYRSNGNLEVRTLLGAGATLGNLEPLDLAADELKEQVDFYFRHKINFVRVVPAFLPRRGADSRLYAEAHKRAREVADYAEARGVNLREHSNVEISDYLSEEEAAIALERQPGTRYMWAAIDAHRRYAEDYTRNMLGTRNGLFSIHPFDGGGYVNPTNWSDRDPRSDAMYGDDRAWADLEQMQIYFQTVRAAHPDVKLEAVIYPYHYQLARDDFAERYRELAEWMPSKGGWFGMFENSEEARRVQDQLIAYNRFLAEHLPEGTAIGLREADRATFDALRRLYEGYPISLWIYPGRNAGWRGTFTPQVRYAKTWYDPKYRDHYFLEHNMAPTADGRVNRLAQQEYLWNVDRPDGSADFDLKNRFYEHGGRHISDFQREHLIPRMARILYDDAAEAFAPLIAANLSFGYVSAPEEMARVAWGREYLDDPYRYMDEQAAAMAEAHVRLQPHVEKEQPDPWAVFYYRYTGTGAIRAELESALNRARSAGAAEAHVLARQMVSRLPELQQRVDQVRQRSDSAWARVRLRTTFVPSYKGGSVSRLDTFQPLEYRDAFSTLL